MVTIQLKIKNCSECPNCKVTRLYTEDSWEHAEDYWCMATPDVPLKEQGRSTVPYKLISGYVEWDREIPIPPAWCPIASPEYKKELRITAIKWELLALEGRVRTITDMGGVPGDALMADILKLKAELTELTACFTCGCNPCMCDQQ